MGDRILVDFLCREDLGDGPMLQADNLVAQRDQLIRLATGDDYGPSLGQFVYHIPECLSCSQINAHSGFVEDDELDLGRDQTSDECSLLIAAR